MPKQITESMPDFMLDGEVIFIIIFYLLIKIVSSEAMHETFI